MSKTLSQEEALPVLQELLREAEAQGVRGRINTIWGESDLKVKKPCMSAKVRIDYPYKERWEAQFEAVPSATDAEGIREISEDFAWLVEWATAALARLNGEVIP